MENRANKEINLFQCLVKKRVKYAYGNIQAYLPKNTNTNTTTCSRGVK